MPLEQVFSIASAAALLGWVLLAAAPLQRHWAVVGARLVVALLCGGYAAMLIAGLTGGKGPPAGADFNSLAGVRLLLSSPDAALAGWVHYLAFDLFVGAWETEDARGARIPHWLLLPCLALTLFAGPVGLLLYLVIKAARRR
jgi:hypothetical protein